MSLCSAGVDPLSYVCPIPFLLLVFDPYVGLSDFEK